MGGHFVEYALKEIQGDSRAVPQLVFNQLQRADGDSVRAALYLIAGGSTDPKQMARELRLKSVRAAENILQFWAGAGLLEPKNAPRLEEPAPVLDTRQINLAAMRDPMVATLMEEVQAHFGKVLSHSEMQRLAGLYLQEEYPLDVILICCAYLAQSGKRTVARLSSELARWRENGVETGEQAERYLVLLERRRKEEEAVAPLFGITPQDLTLAQKRSIYSWFEDWNFSLPMIREALVHAEDKNTIRYVNGILRTWHSQGYTQPSQVQGSGVLQGSNITSTAAQPTQASGSIQAMFSQDWNQAFED